MEGAIIIVDAPDLSASVSTPIDRSIHGSSCHVSLTANPPTPLFIAEINGWLLCPTASPVVASPAAGGTHAAARRGRQRAGQDATVHAALPNKANVQRQSDPRSAPQRSHGLASYACLAPWPVRSPLMMPPRRNEHETDGKPKRAVFLP